MQKIVHIGKYYAPEAGGIENVTYSIAKGGVNAGFKVTVVCFGKNHPEDVEIMDGVEVIRTSIDKLIASQPLGLKYMMSSIKEARKADIVHVHLPNMLGALCCLIIGKRPRLLLHWHSDVINKGILAVLLRPLEKALLKRADVVVATSQAYAEASPLLQDFKNKVTIVPIGVPDVVSPGSGEDHAHNLPLALQEKLAGKKLVLAVGRLVEYKGFNVLIEAAKSLNDNARVVIVGDGPLRDNLKALIVQHGLENKVYLAGRLSDASLKALFARAAVYCLPSVNRAEAFGVVLVEAMAHGIPVVATEIFGSGVPWVNQHGVSGLNVAVGDPVALAAACNQLLANDSVRNRFAEGARQRFTAEFTEDISVKKMLDTYQQLIAA